MQEKFESDYLPVLALRDMVVFPASVTPLMVMRPASLAALEAALARDKRLFLVAQHDPEVEEPGNRDLHPVGTVAEVVQLIHSPEGGTKILVEGSYTARAVEMNNREGYLQAFVVLNQVNSMERRAIEAHQRTAARLFEIYAAYSEKIPPDLQVTIRNIKDPLRYLYTVAHYASFKTSEKQQILESNSLEEKYHLLNQFLDAENQILELETKIHGEVKHQIGKSQREYYLNEQLKAIERELGVNSDEDPDIRELVEAIEKSGMPEQAREKVEKELARLGRMPPMSPEAVVTRTFIEWLTEVPWTKRSEDRIDLEAARRILDEDHYGLKKIKERIVEYLAVVKHAGQGKGPILCFVGPPGVGKTSLGRSIARCVNREFVRISLGGVRDEAEIRGHRRTYVGSLPGKIVQSMKRAGTVNPVFLLDEIDKMSSDFRGDPAAALLEVLDPEQNKTFNDHYLEVDYDLSQVMFITTANTMDGIPYPLLDRMELIRLPGYTEEEKLQIAKRHLLPRQRKQHGLAAADVKLSKTVLTKLVTAYTREAGVRELDRTLAALCRKIVVEKVEKPKAHPGAVSAERLREHLGPEKYRDNALERRPEIGIALGLAWTEAGGELLPVETTPMAGKGNLSLTGKLGEVMQESARTAFSYIRSRADDLGIDPAVHTDTDIHIHVPEGAIPKDGPSAGITIATSLASALGRIPVRQDVAMTGEITLRGNVLKIGGLKEKVLAAHRRKVREIVFPRDNVDDLEEIPADVRKRLVFHPVSTIDEVFDIALVRPGKKKASKPGASRPRRSRTTGTQPRAQGSLRAKGQR